jgi:hypothetical protein
MQKNKLTGILILFVLSILTIGVANAAVLGFTQADIKSNYLGFDKAWVISWVADDYTTSSLEATLTPADMKGLTGTQSGETLTINTLNKENYCEYAFDTTQKSVKNAYDIKLNSNSFWGASTATIDKWVSENCNTELATPTYRSELFGGWKRLFCIDTTEKVGTFGVLTNEKSVSNFDWYIQAGGKTQQSALITTDSTGVGKSTKLGDNVIIQWQGSLITGESCPDVSNKIGIHSSSLGGWIVIDSKKYDDYAYEMNNLQGLLNDLVAMNADSSEMLIYENRINAKANTLKTGALTTYIVTTNTLEGGKAKYNLNRQIMFPLFRLIIDADYLTMVENAGIPKITSVSPNPLKFTEGETKGILSVTIKNLATVPAKFNVRVINCDNSFSSGDSFGTDLILAGESKVVSILVTGSSTITSPTVSGKCTIEVKDALSQKTDTQTFGVVMTQLQDCTPNEKVCGFEGTSQAVKKCNSQGTKYEILAVCSSSQICENAECIEKECVGSDCPCTGNNCNFSWLLFIITFVLATGGAYAVYGLAMPIQTFRIKGKPIGKIILWALTATAFVLIFVYIPNLVQGIIDMFTL